MRELPSLVKGAGLRTLSFRSSWVRIPPPASNELCITAFLYDYENEHYKSYLSTRNNANRQLLSTLYKFL
jgi:hypothetical protein